MSAPVPQKIRLTDDRKALQITWSDEVVCTYPMPLLRKNCPCATCQKDFEEKGSFYIPLFTAESLHLMDVRQQGHYAIQLVWGDGHHSGIYDYPYLRTLCPEIIASAGTES
ncbi:MAG: DUF971 domain-containing protein [Bacteroidetes bacterium]|nr:DUF971 domain-containing protein [Bacteroidota bacterium]